MRKPALAIEIALYTACCLVAYFIPGTVTPFPSEANFVTDVISGVVISGTVLSTVAVLGIRIYTTKNREAKQLLAELMERNEALARYDRMKSEFLSMVAHEVSTPMTTIMASGRDTLDLLKEEPLNIEEIAENQRRIENKVMLIDGIITDLMDAVAIENGRLSLNLQQVGLAELLRISCGAHVRHQDRNYNKITYALQPGLPPVMADPVRIEQVMLNLLSNAVRHTFGGVIEVKLEEKDGAQVVSVTDDGEGMDKGTLGSAFDRGVSTKGDYWRHGFGLHVSRLIIKAHGGEIWINSEKGRGTRVSFSLT